MSKAPFTPEEGGSSNPNPAAGDSSIPDRPAGDSLIPDRPAGDSSIPDRPAGDSLIPDPPAGDSSIPDRPAGDSSIPDRPAGDSSIPDRPAGDSSIPDRPAGDSSIPDRPAGDSSIHLSRLCSPVPRGGYSPSLINPQDDQSPRDDYFVLRPGSIEEAIKDTTEKLTEEDGAVESAWLLTEVDHWNRESERLVLIAAKSLLICKYDFIGLYCTQILRIPLNYIDSITFGPFSFPDKSFSRRAGDGLRIKWDKLRQPSFLARWNPWSHDLPYVTLTEHPTASRELRGSKIVQFHSFRMNLTDSLRRVHRDQSLPGRANGALFLEQSIRIDTYLGLVSSLTNWSQLGYAKPRGSFGF